MCGLERVRLWCDRSSRRSSGPSGASSSRGVSRPFAFFIEPLELPLLPVQPPSSSRLNLPTNPTHQPTPPLCASRSPCLLPDVGSSLYAPASADLSPSLFTLPFSRSNPPPVTTTHGHGSADHPGNHPQTESEEVDTTERFHEGKEHAHDLHDTVSSPCFAPLPSPSVSPD